MKREREFYIKYRDHGKRYWWFGARRGILHEIALRYSAGHAGTGRRVLDVGCGPGVNLSCWKDLGDVFGVDLSFDAVAMASEEDGSKVVTGDAVSIPFKDGSFDTVFALDIIEHLDEPGRCLDEIYRVTKPAGLVVITVPAYQFLFSPVVDHGHKKRYVAREVRDIVKEAGFEIIRVTYFNTLLFPLMALQRLFLRMNKREDEDAFKVVFPEISNTLNSILESIFRQESILLNRVDLPFGGSILCVSMKLTGADK